MKNNYSRTIILLVAIVIFSIGGKNVVFAQSADDGKRYNLAVYTTGTQNDQTLSISLQNVIQNKTITKLTKDGNFRLIERSGEFLKQIQSEQTMQQSGDVADGQIAEIGAGYGAEKICVVSVSIINQYLYIATRIVDVATKTSFESGDAETTDYNSMQVVTKTLEKSLNKMLAAKVRKPLKTSQNTIIETPQVEESVQSSQPSFSYDKTGVQSYKLRLKKEAASFLDMNSLAYSEYTKFNTHKNVGWFFLSFGIPACCVGVPLMGVGLEECSRYGLDTQGWVVYEKDGEVVKEYYRWLYSDQKMAIGGIATTAFGLVCIIVGAAEVVSANKHLQKSYQYYIQGEKQTATLNFHPYFGNYNTMGAGLTLRF